MMTEAEFNFLRGRYDYKKEEVFAYCRNFGWCTGFDLEGNPVLTKKGVKAFKAYRDTT